MTERREVLNPLLFAVSLCVALSAPSAMARGGGGGGGGHFSGGHCGGSHFSGSHFGGGHCGGGHFSGSHFGGGSHFSGSHISAGHSFSSCGTHSSNFSGHTFSSFGSRSSHLTSTEHLVNECPGPMYGNNMHLQEIGSPSSNYSSIVRSEPHAGLLGHIHRFFTDKPCELQNIHTEIMPQALTEIVCEPVLTPPVTHQIFARENYALSALTAKTTCLRGDAQKYRYLNQTSRTVVAAQPYANYFNINIDNTAYPASDVNMVLENESGNNIATEVVESDVPPTFSGLSYMLPNPGGILSIYFSYESTINNFLMLHKGSFLTAAMNQTL